MTVPFPMVEKAIKELIVAKIADATGRVGGDLSYETDQPFYIWLGLVGGSTSATTGLWTLDIDVFDSHYSQAMDLSLALEAMLLSPGGHRTSLMILDSVSQNEVPVERPWDDESAYRIGATYTFTARRTSGGTIVLPPPVTGDVVGAIVGQGPPPVDLVADPGDQYFDELTGDLYTME